MSGFNQIIIVPAVALAFIIVISVLIYKIRRSFNGKKPQPASVPAISPDKITNAQVRAVLVTIGLPQFVVDVFDKKVDLADYGIYDCFIDLRHFFTMPKELLVKFQVDRYVPLFETADNFGEVLAYDTVLNGFVRYAPNKHKKFDNYPVLTWDGIFVRQILTWYEDGKGVEKIFEAGKLFGLKNTKRILHSIYKELGAGYTPEAALKWESDTIDRIGARIK